MSRGGAEREGDTESEAGCSLQAVSTEPDVGLELMNREIMTWASRTLNRLSHPGAPKVTHFLSNRARTQTQVCLIPEPKIIFSNI